MKKFKVIEHSRFLNADDKKNVLGGNSFQDTICTTAHSHTSCDMIPVNYTSCGAGVAAGYSWGPGGESCGGSGIRFKTTNCGGLGWFSTTCGGGSWYRI